jgi:SAM-dependent methyltransferase
MKECSKSIQRRLDDSRFTRRYFVGRGVDIGGRPDPLALYLELFPLAEDIRTWDIEDGDAQQMKGVPDGHFDFVHSSHCLEHLNDPVEGLRSWLRVLVPGGHLIVVVPDEDLYEQGEFPSTFNRDHKWTFTIHKPRSWSANSINLMDLLLRVGPELDVLRIERLDETYRWALPRYDQTLTPVAECGIEIVARKRIHEELEYGGVVRSQQQPPGETRIHLNQYQDDIATVKESNRGRPPFGNEGEL